MIRHALGGALLVLCAMARLAAADPTVLPHTGGVAIELGDWHVETRDNYDYLVKGEAGFWIWFDTTSSCHDFDDVTPCGDDYVCRKETIGDTSTTIGCADANAGALFFAIQGQGADPATVQEASQLADRARDAVRTLPEVVHLPYADVDVTLTEYGHFEVHHEIDDAANDMDILDGPDFFVAVVKTGDCQRGLDKDTGWPAQVYGVEEHEDTAYVCAEIGPWDWAFRTDKGDLTAAHPVIVRVIDALTDKAKRSGWKPRVPPVHGKSRVLGRYFVEGGRLASDTTGVDALTTVRAGFRAFSMPDDRRTSIAAVTGLVVGSDSEKHTAIDLGVGVGLATPLGGGWIMGLAYAGADRTGPDSDVTFGLEGLLGGVALVHLPLGPVSLEAEAMWATKEQRVAAGVIATHALTIGGEWFGYKTGDAFLLYLGAGFPH